MKDYDRHNILSHISEGGNIIQITHALWCVVLTGVCGVCRKVCGVWY
jgi:hypothetical protein